MNKKFIIEQCRRLKVIHEKESEELIKEGELSKWIIVHNEGHKVLMDGFVNFLNNTDNNDKRIAKKWLNKRIKKSNDIIMNLDDKYNKFINDEVMNEDNDRIYNINDGSTCIPYTLINIIDKKRYISKLKYFWSKNNIIV